MLEHLSKYYGPVDEKADKGYQLSALEFNEVVESMDRITGVVPVPRWLHQERRAMELWNAMFSYRQKGIPYPYDWQREYDDIVMDWDSVQFENFLNRL